MTDRFNRDIKLNIGGIPIESKVKTIPQNDTPQPMLKIEFSIKKDLNRDPNTAEVVIYNLSLNNRSTLQKGADLVDQLREEGRTYDWPLTLEAGYVGNTKLLFKGDITLSTSFKDNVDWATSIECGDGEKKYRTLQRSLGRVFLEKDIRYSAKVLC
jgi:hypothetical protein